LLVQLFTPLREVKAKLPGVFIMWRVDLGLNPTTRGVNYSKLFFPNFQIVISTGDLLTVSNEMNWSDNRLRKPENPISRSSWGNKYLIN
jgi:hypothetical protein